MIHEKRFHRQTFETFWDFDSERKVSLKSFHNSIKEVLRRFEIIFFIIISVEERR